MKKEITNVPHRLERLTTEDMEFLGLQNLPPIGWTVSRFVDAENAANFVIDYQHVAMPCWQRFEIIDKKLILKK